METRHLTFSLLLQMTLTSLAATTPEVIPLKSLELVIATEEMARANYFTFVMLINMTPLEQRLQNNVTFLMPNDKMLSKTRIPKDSISDFLLRHSIPSPLLYGHLEHIPSGAILPSSEPGYMLNITNKGRRSYFLNNVRLISPNICTSGTSIRCHGIDGVLEDTKKPPSPTCSQTPTAAPPVGSITPPTPSFQFPSIPPVDFQVAAPPYQNKVPGKSGSSLPNCVFSHWMFVVDLALALTLLVVFL